MPKTRLLLSAAAFLVVAVPLILLQRPVGERSAAREEPSAVRLAGSTDALREAFNRERDSPRLLAVLSPSCPVCFDGATAAAELLTSDESLHALFVWMDVLPWDGRKKAGKRIETFADRQRLAQFYDPRQLTGREIAARLGWPEQALAWDVYLFFAPGAVWEEEPPAAADWVHQRRGLEPLRYRTAEELLPALRLALRAASGSRPR